MKQRGMIIRLSPTLANLLRESYAQMKQKGITDAKTLQDAIIHEICNLPCRWEDALYEQAKGGL